MLYSEYSTKCPWHKNELQKRKKKVEVLKAKQVYFKLQTEIEGKQKQEETSRSGLMTEKDKPK